MLTGLVRQWRDMTKIEPGKRFQNRYYRRGERRCTPFVKPFYMLLGAMILISGLVLIPAPGPGCLVALIGATMLAEESLAFARTLDSMEVKTRRLLSRARKAWTHASATIKAAVALVAASVAGVAGVVAYNVFVA